MRRRERRPFELFSLSFLDVVCCGFGAIILLFVLNKMGEPAALERAQQDLSGLLARLEEELALVRGETTVLNRDLRGRDPDALTAAQAPVSASAAKLASQCAPM